MHKEWKKDKFGFRLRGDHMTRIDGFSDVVFGFALTLLVVSLEVPKTYRELESAMGGFFAFAICFYLLISFWHSHYTFFRRYDLSDMRTITLNSILLFIILFFVYPMKFLFLLVTLKLTGAPDERTRLIFDTNTQVANVQVEHLMMLYGLGFFMVYAVFALMHLHAWAKRDELELNALERHLTIESIANKVSVGFVGLLCIFGSWITRDSAPGIAGWVFMLIAPIQTVLGIYFRRKRDRLFGPHKVAA